MATKTIVYFLMRADGKRSCFFMMKRAARFKIVARLFERGIFIHHINDRNTGFDKIKYTHVLIQLSHQIVNELIWVRVLPWSGSIP